MTMPSQESSKPGLFDRFAAWVDKMTSKAWFFFASVVMVAVWAPSYPFVGNIDTYQLLINTPTTVLTFLLVAVQQNAGQRDTSANQTKLNAIAKGLTCALIKLDCEEDAEELKHAVGLEDREST